MTNREKRLERLKTRQTEQDKSNTIDYAYKIPKDIPIYKVKEGQNLIDIIPYRISNPNNPAIRLNGFELGDEDYFQHLQTHQNIGSNKNEYLCRNKMFGKKCPICEAQNELWDVDKTLAKALYPKDHVVYNIIDLLEPEKGIQVWKISKFWVEDNLVKLSAMKSKSGDPIIYGDWEIGWSIEFYGMEQKFNGNKFFKPENFSFIKREEKYEESIVDKAYPIDQWYNIVEYDTIFNDYNGIEAEEESDKEVQKRADRFEEDTEIKKAVDKAVKEDDNDSLNELAREYPKEVEKIAPIKQKEETKLVETKVEEEKPRSRRRERNTSDAKLCPAGFKWGECDKHDECKSCKDEDYNNCADIQDGVMTVDEL